ncbi:MAG: anti-sigma factor [Actinomycetota bacterium]
MNHEAMQELLAGYALRSLSGEDAAAADRLLVEHVPGCSDCRRTLDAFQLVSADLALDADPITPPETLLPRLHREMGPQARRRRPVYLVAVAASVAAAVTLGGFALTEGGRANRAQTQADFTRKALDFARTHNADMTPVGPTTEISSPGVREFYIYGNDVPTPAPGLTYGLWAIPIQGSQARFLGDFMPDDDGYFGLRLLLDPTGYDHLLITEEQAGIRPAAPGATKWESAPVTTAA